MFSRLIRNTLAAVLICILLPAHAFQQLGPSQVPIATNSANGVSHPDGTTITVDGTGKISASPALSPANPSASVGTSAVNGSAATYMRSDAAPPINQAISPTWTGAHTFSNNIVENNGYLLGLPSFINGPNGGTESPLQYANVELAGNSTNSHTGGNVVQFQFSNDASSAFLGFAKSRSSTKGTLAALQSGDGLGEINYIGADGTNWIDSAYFDAFVDGTVSANVIPTRFAWGSINTSGVYNEHMRLSANAVLTVGDTINNTYNLVTTNPEPAGTYPVIQFANPGQTNVGMTFNTQGSGGYTFTSGGSSYTPIFSIVPASSTVAIPTLSQGYACVGSGGLISSASSCSTSDGRLKMVERPLIDGLQRIAKLKPVVFFYKDQKHYPNGRQIGLIAQDVEKQFPELVSTNSDGWKTLDYAKLTAPIIVAIKELKDQVDSLRDQNVQMFACQQSVLCRLFGW